MGPRGKEWQGRDLNPRPRAYESPALTRLSYPAEKRAAGERLRPVPSRRAAIAGLGVERSQTLSPTSYPTALPRNGRPN